MKHKALSEPKPSKAFRNKYLAAIMAVAALLISSIASAQTDSLKYSQINGYGFKYKRHAQDSVSIIPLSTSPHTPYRAGGIRYRASDSTLQLWTGYQWNSIITGIGNGVDTAYALNDSTIAIETPDQDFFVQIPGRYWDLQGVLNNGSTLTENETITLLDSLRILSGLVVVETLRISSLTTSTDTTTYKPLGINSSGNVVKFGTWPGSGGGTPGGSNTQIQYNNSGSFGAEAAFTYNATTNKLTTDSVRFLKGIADSIMMGSFEPDLIDSATFFGTSITAGTNALPVGTNRYSAIVSGGLRVNEINKGLGGYLLQKSPGWPLTNTFKDVYATMIQPKTPTSRYLFFAWGENDADAEESYGGLFGVDTVYFKRDYLIAIQFAQSQGWSLSDIRIISPFYQLESRTALSFQQKYFDAAKNFADSMGIQFIDVFTQGKNYGNLILDDDIHPSNYGHALAAYAILKVVNQPLQAQSGENLINAGTTLLNEVKFFGKDTATAGHSLAGVNSNGSLVRVAGDKYLIIDNTDVAIQSGNGSLKGNFTGNQIRATGNSGFLTGAGFEMGYSGGDGTLIPYNRGGPSFGNIFMPFSKLVVGNSTPTSPFSQLFVSGRIFGRGLFTSGDENEMYNTNDAQVTSMFLVKGDSIGSWLTKGAAGYRPTAINGSSTQPVLINTFTYGTSGASLIVNGAITTVTDSAASPINMAWIDTNGKIRKAAVPAGGGGSGITSLNSQTGSSQTFAVDGTGTDIGINSSSDVHTLSVPSASATARGVITTGSQTIAGTKTFSSDMIINTVNIGTGPGNFPSNTRIGNGALVNNSGDNGNTAIGDDALNQNSTGYFNTAIGRVSLTSVSTGLQNTAIGHAALQLATGSGNVAIGYNAGALQTTGDNKLYIANSNTAPLLYGDFSTGQLQINAASTPTLTASAALEIISTTRGFLPPVMTAAQRAAISSPTNGLQVFDTDSLRMFAYNGGWKGIAWTSDVSASGITSINSQTGPAITLTGGIGTYTSAPSANTIAYNVDPTSDIFTRTVDAIMTTAGNTGTGETDLYSKTVAGGTLNTDKQTLNFEADGEFNDNTATATLKLYFGGNVTLNTGAINISTANTAWRLRGYIIRTSSTTAHVTYELQCPGLATPLFIGYSNLTSLDLTVGNIFKITAQAGGAGGGNDDITAHSWQVTYKPQP